MFQPWSEHGRPCFDNDPIRQGLAPSKFLSSLLKRTINGTYLAIRVPGSLRYGLSLIDVADRHIAHPFVYFVDTLHSGWRNCDVSGTN